jgi:hypothetical protein
MQRRFLFGVMGLVLGVLALSARAQSGSTSISHVTATVAKADLHGYRVRCIQQGNRLCKNARSAKINEGR